jgi:hypothetical protein
MPFQRPVIHQLSPQFAVMSKTLILHGQNLKGQSVKVLFGDLPPVIPAVGNIKNNVIEVSLPVGLRAGVNTVRVVHEMNLATGPHRIFESNTAAFMLRPEFKSGTPPKWESSTSLMELTFDQPFIGKKQRVVLLLNQYNPPAGQEPVAYKFKASKNNGIAPGDTETDSINILCKGVAAGDYLVRVRVDGAESALISDGSGKFIEPKVTIS